MVRGDYADPNHDGQISHFKALTTALSGTVGVGNIGAVAFAITIGGPGALFWIIVGGLLGASLKCAECTLGVKYRTSMRMALSPVARCIMGGGLKKKPPRPR